MLLQPIFPRVTIVHNWKASGEGHCISMENAYVTYMLLFQALVRIASGTEKLCSLFGQKDSGDHTSYTETLSIHKEIKICLSLSKGPGNNSLK